MLLIPRSYTQHNKHENASDARASPIKLSTDELSTPHHTLAYNPAGAHAIEYDVMLSIGASMIRDEILG